MSSIAASSQNTIDTMEPEHWSTMELPDNGERAGYDTKTIPMTKHQPFTSIGNLIDAGLWESTPGGFAIKNRKDTETIYILSGTATITDEAMVLNMNCAQDRGIPFLLGGRAGGT